MNTDRPTTVIERILSEVMFSELKNRGFDERLIRSMLKEHMTISDLLSETLVKQNDVKEKE